MKVVYPPERISRELLKTKGPSVGLFGSIEMGNADRWQYRVSEDLQRLGGEGLVFNPRRPDWDSSWEQKIGNSNFKEQVDWELAALDACKLAVFNFDPETKSPVTLFELGLAAGKEYRTIVFCPEPYWRKGNVDIYCQRFGLQQVTTFEELLYEIRKFCVDCYD